MLKNEEKVRQVGLNIAFYRKKRGWRQEDLAYRVYVTREQISRIESPNNKASATLDVLLSISDALEIDICDLFKFK